MARMIQPARVPGGGSASPEVLSGVYATGQTFKKGAILVLTGAGAGTLAEAGADPIVGIKGVALEPAGSRPGYEPANDSQVLQVTGINQEVSYAVANTTTVFSSRLRDAGTNEQVTPTQTMIGEQKGLSEDADGIWCVDVDLNDAVVIVDIDIDQKLVFFKFLSAAITSGPVVI